MGGLIGTATQRKDGLLRKDLAPLKTVDDIASTRYYLKIKKLSGFSAFITTTAANDVSNIYYLSLAERSSGITAKMKAIAVLLSGNTLYAKQDSEYIYITKAFGSFGGIVITPITSKNNASIEYTSIDVSELPSDATDITIQS